MSRDDETDDLQAALEIGATDLTQRALAGQLARAYGRETEIEQLFESLLAKRSVLLLGPSDVGKTAVLHEAVHRMARKQCPHGLAGKRVVAISTGAVLAGTRYLGEWQTRLTTLLDAVKASPNLYLYFEDIWSLRDAGRASDKTDGFSTLIRPYLERQDITLLGEATPESYTMAEHGARSLADDQPFIKLFDVLTLQEPPRDDTRKILTSVARDLHRAHHVRIEPAAIERALELTRRFLPYQAFPGKATHLLAEAAVTTAKGARAAATPAQEGREPAVTSDMVGTSFSHMTGLPEKIISDHIPLTQDEITTYFAEHIVGQEEAVRTVADVVTLVKAELNDPGRPLGVLFFVGPTGVGKTELAKTLAEYLFGSKDKLLRFDMSEFKTYQGVQDLLEQLTEKQRRQSFSVLLLDEIEKAAPFVFDLFLQVFDDARLTDSSGRSVDLHNTIIIATSNIGTGMHENRSIGFVESGDSARERSELVRRAVEEYFRPEFINRLDKIVVFQPLGREEMRQIARRELNRALLREGVSRRNILLDFREDVLDVLLTHGFSPAYGARPLQRAIKEQVLLPLARRIAAQPTSGEQLLELYARDGIIEVAIIPVSAAEADTDETLEELRQRATVTDASTGRPRSLDLHQFQDAIAALSSRLEASIKGERHEAMHERGLQLLEEISKPGFWDEPERARQTLSAIYHVERVTERFESLRNRAERLAEVAEMIRRHGDAAGLPRLAASLELLERDVALAELELLSGDDDTLLTDAVFLCVTPYLTPRAREAGDWPTLLYEMYAAWARRKGYEVETVSEEGHDPILLLRGPGLCGLLRGEDGIHKLQREAAGANDRHGRPVTRLHLARVDMLAVPGAEAVEALRARARVVVRDEEPGGRDGKKVRTAEAVDPASGLRVHIRAADAERVALSLLAVRCAVRASGSGPAEPSVVRVYRLARTQYVRDPRTGERSGKARDVLSGAIDPFLLAYIKQRAGSPQEEPAAASAPATRQARE
jgi:ATP-dependent Clp protease ATP-binding subunit ClpA